MSDAQERPSREECAGRIARLAGAMQAGGSPQHILLVARYYLLRDADLAARLETAEAACAIMRERAERCEAAEAELLELRGTAQGLANCAHDSLADEKTAKQRVRELEAEVERLREDATLGADLRCVLESGFEVEVNRGEWSICIERWSPFRTLAETAAVVREWQAGEGFAVCVSCRDRATCAVAREGTRPTDGHAERPCPHYRPVEPAPSPEDVARPARIVGRVTRPVWEAEPADGMEPAPSPEDEARYCPWCGSPVPGGLVTLDDLGATSCERCGSAVPEGGGPLCEECVDKPAPSPEDAARARIAAAGATIYEGRALRVEAANGVWSTRSVVEDEAWVLEELADFAEAHDSGTDKNTKAL